MTSYLGGVFEDPIITPSALEHMPRRIRVAVSVVVFGAALGACSGQSLSANGVVVLVGERSGDEMDALGGGQLEVLDGCLGAGGAVIVWPHGTTITDEDPLTIEIPENGSFGVGDTVSVGGGYVLEHSSTTREPGPFEIAGVEVPAACADHDIFLSN